MEIFLLIKKTEVAYIPDEPPIVSLPGAISRNKLK
jgi:hypothetical protein